MQAESNQKKPCRVLRFPVLFLLFLYTRYISLLLAPRCRFYPSCSRYAYDAVNTHGVIKGLYFALRRLLRCHPWHEGGFDPVPESHARCCTHQTGQKECSS